MAPRAAARLETMGFRRVHEYKAGKLDWMAAGLPTEGDKSLHPRAGDASRKDVPVCSLTEKLGDVRGRVKAAGWDAAIAVDSDRIVLGLLILQHGLSKWFGIPVPGPATVSFTSMVITNFV